MHIVIFISDWSNVVIFLVCNYENWEIGMRISSSFVLGYVC